MTSSRGPAEHDRDRPGSLAASVAQAVIGNRLRLPQAPCEGGACGARFEDPAALGEGDLRTRAIAAGWREDAVGLLTCPACQRRAPWPDSFRRGRRAAHSQPAGPPQANGRPAARQPTGQQPPGPMPPPGFVPPAGRQPESHRLAESPLPAPPVNGSPRAGTEPVTWPPPDAWPDPPPDSRPPEGDSAFTEWEAWRAG